MEEILASIRRIIADEDPARAPNESPPSASEAVGAEQPPSALSRVAPRPAPRVAPSDPPKRDEDIDSMLAQLQATSRQAPASAEDPAHPVHAVDEPAAMRFDTRPSEPATPRTGEDHRPAAPKTDRGLMSAATTAAVESAFHSLAETAQVRSGRTLEDVVSDILRPMLKAWLDENLPGLVERLVRAEIERVARGKG
jgi:cell pole-organizing protein PopZ